MTTAMHPVLSRMAAVALLIGAIAIISGGVGLPIFQYVDGLRARIEQERDTLGRFEAFAVNAEATKALTAQSEAAMMSGAFLMGDSEALKVARLQAVITQIAQKQGVRLLSTRALPAREENTLQLLGVQVELETDIEQLQAMLLAFEANRPALFLNTMQITPAPDRRSANDMLRVRMGIFGAAAGKDTKL